MSTDIARRTPDELALKARLELVETQLRELRIAAGVEPRAAPLGFFTVAPGATILADHMNSAIQQGVPQFASAAARTAAWPSPHKGAMSYLSDVNRYDSYTGSAWTPHPPAVIYAKVLTRTTDASSGFATITPADMGMTTITGGVANVNWGTTAGTDAQFADARVSGGNLQVRIWKVSAFSAGTVTICQSLSVTLYIVAW